MTDEDRRRLTLADLVRIHQQRTGESYATIARRAGMSKAKVGQIADPASPFRPRRVTLGQLATGLQVPLEVVYRAAALTTDDEPHRAPISPTTEVAVERLRSLTPEHQDVAATVIESLWRSEGGHAGR